MWGTDAVFLALIRGEVYLALALFVYRLVKGLALLSRCVGWVWRISTINLFISPVTSRCSIIARNADAVVISLIALRCNIAINIYRRTLGVHRLLQLFTVVALLLLQVGAR